MLSAEPSDPREVFLLEVERTAHRLRSMSLAKLDTGTRVADTRVVIKNIAAYGLMLADQQSRPVPDLTSSALADQLIVVARRLSAGAEHEKLREFSESLRLLRATL